MFQLQDAALFEAGLKDGAGKWTGKWGVSSDDDFFANTNHVQERAFEEYLDAMHRYTAGNLDQVGKVNQSRILDGKPLTISEAGVMAASQRQGQQWVREYFKWLDANGWSTASARFPDTVALLCSGRTCTPGEIEAKLRSVETRLRRFENVPLR